MFPVGPFVAVIVAAVVVAVIVAAAVVAVIVAAVVCRHFSILHQKENEGLSCVPDMQENTKQRTSSLFAKE